MVQKYFEHIDNVEEITYRKYNVTQKEVEDMIKIVKIWLKSQAHLPLEEDEVITPKIKYFLRGTKMSIQLTKSKLDMYYSCRNIRPELFTTGRQPINKELLKFFDIGYFLPLKKPMGVTRILVGMLTDNDVTKWDILDLYQYLVNMIELMVHYDNCTEEAFVINFDNFTLAHAFSLSPIDIVYRYKIYEKAYAERGLSFHIINCPSYCKNIIHSIKSILKLKLAERIHIHEDVETLYNYIPKEYLPIELNGYETSLEIQRDEWKTFLMNHNDFIKKNISYRSNEKLRSGEPLNTEMFGMQGSFRKLELD